MCRLLQHMSTPRLNIMLCNQRKHLYLGTVSDKVAQTAVEKQRLLAFNTLLLLVTLSYLQVFWQSPYLPLAVSPLSTLHLFNFGLGI